MPVAQKIKSILNRKSSVPEAPVMPATTVAPTTAVVAEPITSDALLAQRDSLATAELAQEEALLNREAVLESENMNVYNNLASDSLLREENLLVREETLLPAQNAYVQSAQRASLVREEPTIIQTIEKDVVIQERIHPVEKEEIQPIIYREREQLDVRQITQMMHETQVQPTLIEQRELAPEVREAIVERAAIPENIVLPRSEIEAIQRTQVVHQPIVEEVIKRTVIEEVQPVLERDVFVPTSVQLTQPVYEKIIEAPTVYREIRTVQELGTRNLGGETLLAQETLLNGGLQGQTLSSSAYEQRVLSENMTEAALLNQQSLSSSSYERQRTLSNERLSMNGSLANQQMLATGQVLPAVQSSRPAYAFLPANYVEPRPQFIGSASDFQRAASVLPQSTFAHAKTLPTVYPMQQAQAPIASRLL